MRNHLFENGVAMSVGVGSMFSGLEKIGAITNDDIEQGKTIELTAIEAWMLSQLVEGLRR